MRAILMVEDEVLASEYLEFVLQHAGYEPIPAASAEEALAVLEHRRDVELVVTDINLPGTMNGLQLAALVRGQWPAINIIVVTGYSSPRSEEIPTGSLFVSQAVQRGKNYRSCSPLPTLTSNPHFLMARADIEERGVRWRTAQSRRCKRRCESERGRL